MRTYTHKKKRARKKALLSRKELLEKKRRVSAAKKGWETRRRNARKKAREAKKRKAPKKVARKKVVAQKKVPRKKAPARRKVPAKRAAQKTKARVRAKKNARVVAKVKATEKKRERSRRKTLTPKKRRREKVAVKKERKKIEEARLLEERVRQMREEGQRERARKREILDSLKKNFKTLLEEAKRKNQLPKPPKKQKVDSERWTGMKIPVSVKKILTEDNVEEVMYRVKQAAERLPLRSGFGWLATINFASLGESLLGYGQVILSSSLPGASLFQAQGIESSGVHNHKEGMLMKLEEKLEVLAGETSSTVWVNFITVGVYGAKR